MGSRSFVLCTMSSRHHPNLLCFSAATYTHNSSSIVAAGMLYSVVGSLANKPRVGAICLWIDGIAWPCGALPGTTSMCRNQLGLFPLALPRVSIDRTSSQHQRIRLQQAAVCTSIPTRIINILYFCGVPSSMILFCL